MAALPNLFLNGCLVKMSEQSLLGSSPMILSFTRIPSRKANIATCGNQIVIQAGIRDSGRRSSASIFVGGFVLGGVIAGALGCIYAPQLTEKDLMRKLPKFIYDEEKALEKTRKVLAQKIEQLNGAIDDVSSQLRADDGPNGVAVAKDEVEPAM